jgi:hypothetical protein
MYAMKNGFWHAQRSISARVHRFFPAPLDHAWFPFKNPSNCLLTERPEFGNLHNGVVLLIRKISRA